VQAGEARSGDEGSGLNAAQAAVLAGVGQGRSTAEAG
jgi:hypothetical protein